MAEKVQEYIANGCQLAWLLDPQKETARVFRANGSVSAPISFDETLSGEGVLPGFGFRLSLLKQRELCSSRYGTRQSSVIYES